MSDDVPVIRTHRAKDRFGMITVHIAYEISRTLAEFGEPDDPSGIVQAVADPGSTGRIPVIIFEMG